MAKQLVPEVSGISRRLRRKSEHLTTLHLPNDHRRSPFSNILSPAVTEEETREEGKVLFGNFVADQINSDLDTVTPDTVKETLEQICTPTGYANPSWAKAGRELRMYADEFQKSKERKKVKKKAIEITKDGERVTKEMFKDLLSELLDDGITKERIIVLFVFCADVAISALKSKVQTSVHLCQQFIQWSLDFIIERVCSWVQQHGGWGAVFSSTMAVVGKVALFVACSIVMYQVGRKVVKSITG